MGLGGEGLERSKLNLGLRLAVSFLFKALLLSTSLNYIGSSRSLSSLDSIFSLLPTFISSLLLNSYLKISWGGSLVQKYFRRVRQRFLPISI